MRPRRGVSRGGLAMDGWNQSLSGNELWRILSLAGILLASLLAGRILHAYGRRMAARAAESRHRLRESMWGSVACASRFVLLCLGAAQCLSLVRLPASLSGAASALGSVLVAVAVGYTAYCLVDVVARWLERPEVRARGRLDDMLAPMVRKSLRVTIVVLTLVQVAQILSDKPITSILAGLGIGGLAVALAAQETIKNFFGSLVILADKPFELGDRIVVDAHDGTVESVGFRSTRLRTLDGELVTFPNGDLANKTIRNIGKRPYIRRVTDLALPYDTPPAKVERALAIVKDVLRNHEGMHPDFPPRVHFTACGSASLNLQVIFWYHPGDWWACLAFTERFNLEILRRFAAEDIEFAFPTQTIYVAGDPRRPLAPAADSDRRPCPPPSPGPP